MELLPNGKRRPLTGAERNARYKKSVKGREKNKALQRERVARKRQAQVYKISDKAMRRDKQRFIEHMAGTPEAQRLRDMRVRLAEERRLATGSARPVKPNPKRGGKGFADPSFATQGHSVPLSRTELMPSHKEGSVFYQSAPANFGKGGQGNKSLREWRTSLLSKGLTLHPARPTEVIKIKDLSKIVRWLP
jgi:hypothetical protein